MVVLTDAKLITCIVQRGAADDVIRAARAAGAQGATASFGRGMGVRERLGVLGFAVNVEKEIINIVVSSEQVERVFESMYLAGNLDTPGCRHHVRHPYREGRDLRSPRRARQALGLSAAMASPSPVRAAPSQAHHLHPSVRRGLRPGNRPERGSRPLTTVNVADGRGASQRSGTFADEMDILTVTVSADRADEIFAGNIRSDRNGDDAEPFHVPDRARRRHRLSPARPGRRRGQRPAGWAFRAVRAPLTGRQPAGNGCGVRPRIMRDRERITGRQNVDLETAEGLLTGGRFAR